MCVCVCVCVCVSGKKQDESIVCTGFSQYECSNFTLVLVSCRKARHAYIGLVYRQYLEVDSVEFPGVC